MSNKTAVNASPFNCRWIVPGSEHHSAGWNYAVCLRVLGTERLVNESDCSHCPRWEEPDDLAEQQATLAWNKMADAESAVTAGATNIDELHDLRHPGRRHRLPAAPADR